MTYGYLEIMGFDTQPREDLLRRMRSAIERVIIWNWGHKRNVWLHNVAGRLVIDDPDGNVSPEDRSLFERLAPVILYYVKPVPAKHSVCLVARDGRLEIDDPEGILSDDVRESFFDLADHYIPICERKHRSRLEWIPAYKPRKPRRRQASLFTEWDHEPTG